MLILCRYFEIRKQEEKDKKIINTERFLDDISGEEL
jgi:hypothetical protein